MAIDRAFLCPCCTDGAGGAGSPINFTDYGHQKYFLTSPDGSALPEELVSQWAWKNAVTIYTWFLQLVGGLVAGAPVIRIRLREGGTADLPDGKVVLDTGPIQTNAPAWPAAPEKHCFSGEPLGVDEGPCDLLKVTIEAQSTDPENPEFFTVQLSGIHVDVET